MVKRIHKFMSNDWNRHFKTSDDGLEACSELLKVLEGIGMLPPYNEHHGYSNFELAMGVSVEATHSWDKGYDEY